MYIEFNCFPGAALTGRILLNKEHVAAEEKAKKKKAKAAEKKEAAATTTATKKVAVKKSPSKTVAVKPKPKKADAKAKAKSKASPKKKVVKKTAATVKDKLKQPKVCCRSTVNYLRLQQNWLRIGNFYDTYADYLSELNIMAII